VPWRIADALVALDDARGADRGQDADGQVDEEDPVPVEGLGQDAPEHQAIEAPAGATKL
jgi:hypothetical protein